MAGGAGEIEGGIGKNIFNKKGGDGKFLDQKSGEIKKVFAFTSKHNTFIL